MAASTAVRALHRLPYRDEDIAGALAAVSERGTPGLHPITKDSGLFEARGG